MNALVPLIEQFGAISLRASALIGCVLLLRWLLRGRVPAQCFHLLWVLVAVRLLVPFAPESSLSAFNLLHREAADPLTTSGSWVVRKDVAVAGGAVLPAGGAAPLNGRAAETRQPLSPGAVLGLVWLSGVTLEIVLLSVSGWRVRRMIAEAPAVTDRRLREIVDGCAMTLRLRQSVRVLESAAVPGPAVIGLWRPRLLLPPGLSAQLSDEQLRFVLLHECAHLRRHDLAALWLLTAARVVHWFNPVVWLAARAARTDTELACDETVLRHSGEGARVPYGETLLLLMQHLTWRRSALPIAEILESGAAMRARLANIGSYAVPSRWRVLAAAVLLLAVSAVFADEKSESSAEAVPPPVSAPSIAGHLGNVSKPPASPEESGVQQTPQTLVEIESQL